MLPTMQVFAQAWRQLGDAQLVSNAVEAEAADLREQTRQMLLKSEKAYIAMGPLRHKKQLGTITRDEKKELKQLSTDYKEARTAHEALVAQRAAAYDKRYQARRVVARWQQMFDTGVDPGEPGAGAAVTTTVVRREFLMRCPAADCRGFLSTAYKCGVCDHYTCPDCLEHLGASKNIEHKCDANTVETAKAIKKETRPCPKCGARIFKIDGCSQMFCTIEGCQTAFDWNTGQVVSGRIHNPHYYEWMRRQNREIPRTPGDIPGGGNAADAPPFMGGNLIVLNTLFNWTLPINKKDEVRDLFNIHRNIVHITRVEIPRFRPQDDNQVLYQEPLVAYLLNELGDDELKHKLQRKEK
jgi:hypothetical protein